MTKNANVRCHGLRCHAADGDPHMRRRIRPAGGVGTSFGAVFGLGYGAPRWRIRKRGPVPRATAHFAKETYSQPDERY